MRSKTEIITCRVRFRLEHQFKQPCKRAPLLEALRDDLRGHIIGVQGTFAEIITVSMQAKKKRTVARPFGLSKRECKP